MCQLQQKMTLSWQQVLSHKYQYQYQYQQSKYQYKYQYPKIVLKYRSSTSTSTQHNKTAFNTVWHAASGSEVHHVSTMLSILFWSYHNIIRIELMCQAKTIFMALMTVEHTQCANCRGVGVSTLTVHVFNPLVWFRHLDITPSPQTNFHTDHTKKLCHKSIYLLNLCLIVITKSSTTICVLTVEF